MGVQTLGREVSAGRVEARAGTATKEERKQRRKEQKLQRAFRQPLDGRERLRMMADLVDEARRLIEVADHKARFALVIMGAINTGLVLLVTHSPVIRSIPDSFKPWLLVLLIPYAAVTFGFLVHAIEVLRPHNRELAAEMAESRRRSGSGPPAAGERPLGLLYWPEILRKDLGHYHELWRGATVGQVIAELSLLAHGLAHVNQIQYAALTRLFRGLQVMTGLAAVALIVLTALAFR